MIVAKFYKRRIHMDGGPFRVPQSPERRSASPRQSSSQRSSRTSPPKPVAEKEVAVPRGGSPRGAQEQQERPFVRRFLVPIATGLLILGLGVAGGWAVSSYAGQGAMPALDKGRYQAVSLANGQTYFGQLASKPGGYVVLRDIYYLQEQTPQRATDNSDSAADSSATAQLTKRGEAVYGPEDEMIISKDQILFVENLKQDSAVVQLIEEYQQSE